MGKITPRIYLLVSLFGLFSLSAGFALSNDTYGPQKPNSKDQKEKIFIGFLLEVEPSIELEEKIPASCEDATDGALSIIVSGGEEPYTYSWSGPGDSSSLTDSKTINNLGPGEYSVTVTDDTGAKSNASFEVTVDDSTDPVVRTQDINVTLNSNGTFSIQTSDIDNGSTDNCGIENISVSKENFTCADVGENSVTLSVTDVNGNTASETATVTVGDNTEPEVITQNVTVQLDENGQASISPNEIDNGSNDACGIDSLSLDQTNFDCSNIGDNTVSLTVTDENGNSNSKTATVTVEDNTEPEVITQNITVQLDANGQVSISPNEIDNGSNDACGIDSMSLDQTNFDCSNIGDNTVSLTVIDENGNSNSETATVTVEDKIDPEVITQNITVQLDENGQASITVSDIDNGSNDACGIQSTSIDIESFDCSDIGENTVTLTVIDNHNNTANNTAIVTVEDTIKPVLPDINDITWGCEYTVEPPVALDNCDGEITGTADGPTTFSEPGEHSINWSFVDSSGNTSTIIQKITINPLDLQVEKTNVLCNGLATGEATATASGGDAPYTYSWGSLGTGATKTDLPAGTYSVTVTDANGCETSNEVIIEEPNTFIEITDVNTTSGCYQENNGTATVEAQGGTGDYSYLWDNGQTTQTATNLAPGKHSVTITDENGCERIREVTVSSPSELLITGFQTTETTSYGSATGTATAQISGGTPNYSFEWSDGQTGQTARDLLAGTYSVTVTDENGCTAIEEVTIIDALDADIIPTSVCEDDENLVRTSYFEIDNLTAVGGTAPYTYEWDFGNASTPSTATGPGTHRVVYSEIGDKAISVTVTDANGLTFTENIIQYVGGCFADDCGSNDLEAEDYYIGNSAGNEITTENCADAQQKYLYVNVPSAPKRYSLYIEYIYSVENIETGEIENFKDFGCYYNQDDIPDLAQTIPIDYTCGDIVKIEGIYFTFSNNIQWECGEGPSPKCYSTNNEATVRSPLYAVAFPNELLCNGSKSGEIFVRASGGTAPYEYSIDGGNTFQTESTFNQLEAGEYEVEVRDAEGLVYNLITEIEEPSDPLKLEEKENTGVTCFGGEDGSARVEASGGTPNESGDPYIYVWDNGQTTASVNNLAAGEYNVRVLDANGCEVETTIIIEEPAELLADAGPNQVLECGNTSTYMEAVFEPENIEGEPEQSGEWSIVNGPEGGSFEDINDPNTLFNGVQGTYTLRWTVPCGADDDVKISFTNCSTIDFDGIDDYIDFGNNYSTSGNFTFEGWIKQDVNSSSGIKTILSKRDISNYSSDGFDLVVENNIPIFKWNGNAITSDFSIDTDRWYHIAVISNSDETNLYVDGINVTPNNTLKAAPETNTSPFLIGATYNSESPLVPGNYFHGWIEEVRIWNKALTEEQLRFIMNQRLEVNSDPLMGTILPMKVPGTIEWSNLQGYYQLLANESENGFTKDKASEKVNGQLRNIETLQENTAPLPYISVSDGTWRDINIWQEPDVWDPPNSEGINGDPINWNIAEISHTISSGSEDIYLLGLLSEENMLTMANDGGPDNENNSGQGLTISHYLRLNGNIDLVGESQLVQNEGSILEESSSGYVERDQQGTQNSYNYNYWTSPVSAQGSTTNSGYLINNILKDGTDSNDPQNLSFAYAHTHADANYNGNKRISTYWLHKFHGTANVYGEWKWIGANSGLKAAEGFTMKGTSGQAKITDKQNYVFRGKPNNGTITREISNQENRLLGNPYPSAIDADQFIRDNLKDVDGGNNSQNIFNGALYFWDHFGAENTHILREYIGGYATYTLAGGVEAASTDTRIDNTGDRGDKKPGRYIPVAQGFFVNSVLDDDIAGNYTISGGDVEFRNRQRVFVREDDSNYNSDSQFLKPENSQKGKQQETQAKYTKDNRYKIRLNFNSPKGYNRQILVTADGRTSNEFDLGYDAPLIDNNVEDMFWMINSGEFVIQAVPNFNKDQVLPLGIKIAEEGQFTIEVAETTNLPEAATNLYIRDNTDSTYYDIKKEKFKVNAAPGMYEGDYDLVFHDGSKTEKEQPQSGQVSAIYSFDNKELSIRNPELIDIHQVIVYTITGSRVVDFTNIPTAKEVPLYLEKPLSSAVYIVRIYTEKGEYANKIIAKH